MKIPGAKTLNQDQAQQLMEKSHFKGFEVKFFNNNHRLEISYKHQWLLRLFLPWNQVWSVANGFKVVDDSHIGLVMIRAGQAIAGYFHNGELIDHKVFRAYMVRKKQGKSQIKHLKTKGKSRAGSRIRLEESVRFFEEINERLTYYEKNFPVDLWGISCSKTLWPYFFSVEPPPPFTGLQEGLIELPFHINQASFDELKEAQEVIFRFNVLISEAGLEYFSDEFNTATNNTDENW